MVSTALANKYLQKLENLINTNELLEQAWLDILDSQVLVDLYCNDVDIQWGATRATFIFDKEYVIIITNLIFTSKTAVNMSGRQTAALINGG